MTNAVQNSESRGAFKALAALIWLAVPLNVAIYAIAWNRLPARLATHFNFSNQPNGWMSREGALLFFLLFTTLVAGTATWVLSRISRPDAPAWALLIFFYVIVAVLTSAEHSVIAYNADGQPVKVIPVLGAGMLAAAVVMVIAAGARRGPALDTGSPIAEERHSSARWAALQGIGAMVLIRLVTMASIVALQLALGLSVAMMVAATALAWSGFHYLFTREGVEIRTMGFRLRSIPATDIQSYAVERWNWLGGYGIRGVGNRRAYVWSNSGVRIHTREGGEIFLGHDDPQKLVHDLDRITKSH
jgi:hypothetical protein